MKNLKSEAGALIGAKSNRDPEGNAGKRPKFADFQRKGARAQRPDVRSWNTNWYLVRQGRGDAMKTGSQRLEHSLTLIEQ